jgi:hypothetical protein
MDVKEGMKESKERRARRGVRREGREERERGEDEKARGCEQLHTCGAVWYWVMTTSAGAANPEARNAATNDAPT